jgi:hypothetical protein
MSSKVSPFFNPSEHLVFHQDKEGNMMGGGYRVNNLLYQHKMPLFVSVGAGAGAQTGGSGDGEGDRDTAAHFIPEKFSDLFRDLAVPAGLFMMPAMFRPRNYAFEVPEAEAKADAEAEAVEHKSRDDSDSDSDSTDDERDYKTTKHAPNDIFDTLLSLVEAKERIHHDVKTRRRRQTGDASENNNNNNKKTKNSSTKRRRMK